jgi:hypothetical protein
MQMETGNSPETLEPINKTPWYQIPEDNNVNIKSRIERLVILYHTNKVLGSSLGKDVGYPEVFVVSLSRCRQMQGTS